MLSFMHLKLIHHKSPLLVSLPEAISSPLPLLKNNPQLLHPHRKRISTPLQQPTPILPLCQPDIEPRHDQRDHRLEFHLGEFLADACVGA